MKEILLNILRKEQEKQGYLTEEALKEISRKTGIPMSRLWGIATFYFLLEAKKTGRCVIHVCNSPSCYVNGAVNIINILKKELKIKIDQTTKEGKFTLRGTSCIGCCDEAPAMMVNGKVYTKLTEKKVMGIINKFRQKK